MIVVDEKESAKLHPQVKAPKLKTVKPKIEKRSKSSKQLSRRDLKISSIVLLVARSIGSALLTGPVAIIALVGAALGSCFLLVSIEAPRQAEFADTASSSIMAEVSASTIEDSTGDLPKSTEISGSYEQSGQVVLKDPRSGEKLETVSMVGDSEHRYTVSGTLDHYSIAFKRIGPEADGKSYRYDSKSGKTNEVTEKELW